MWVWYNGIMTALQAVDEGSAPSIHSTAQIGLTQYIS